MATKAANFVLYACGETRKPLASVEVSKEESAHALFSHRMSEAYRDADRRGVPLPSFVVLLEERTSDDNGNTHARIRRCNLRTLSPETKQHSDVDAAFAASDVAEVQKG